MQHHILKPKLALNKAYLRLKTSRTDIERFKTALKNLLQSIDLTETEEHAKNHLRDFLMQAFYSSYGLNTKGKTDLVIHTGNSTKSNVGVLLEVKRPTNKADMPTAQNLNYNAMHELLLYYLRERVQHKNHDIKHLVITSVHEWFVFDALDFDRLFYRNTQLKKDFTDWSEGRKASTGTDFFYKEIAAPILASLPESITFTHFNLLDYEKPLRNTDLKDDVKLVALYKLLSPAHLLKEPFANDANSLDKGFYQELLHLIGLEEVKEGDRKLIQRKAKPNHGSLLESAYQKLKSEDLIGGLDNPYSFGNTREEQLFNVALELCITWVNRILFLKLLEAQLISYHHGDKKYSFMSTANLREFDDLNELFFDVLAEQPENRSGNVSQKYSHIPYLNSSLFETTALEKRTLRISNLKDRSLLPLYPQTVLRDQQGKPLSKTEPELHTLEYLLRFLGSYDFGAEGKGEIQEENKTLITASVLGLIFEKINGYRDGSFYTPGFITMYMSREAIRRAVVQRFSEKYNWNIDTSIASQAFESLALCIHQNYSLQSIKEYNELLSGLRICDPAVGSGHYLVSALNELIVIKAELKLLLNRQGKPLHYGSIEVQNDELIVTDNHGEPFSYTVHQHPDGHRSINQQTQELREALFHEKQAIIENCLFGVDINPNSVKICRLRLWIELLKNAYYCQDQDVDSQNQDLQDERIHRISTQSESWKSKNPDSDRFTQLQTLPNIDINIKQGNSLLSRYPLTADLHEAFGKKGHSLQAYRAAVANYKTTNSKDTKKELEKFLEEIKLGFRTTLANNDPMRERMSKLRGTIAVMQDPDLFGAKKVDKARLTKLQKELQQLEQERADIEANKVYEGAFEWRFEFPEVLDEEGNYKGFDVVIGNPPYGALVEESQKSYFKNNFKVTEGPFEIYKFFIEKGISLLKDDSPLCYISPDTWTNLNYFKKLRKLVIIENSLLCCTKTLYNVFEEATVDTNIYILQKTKSMHSTFNIISSELIYEGKGIITNLENPIVTLKIKPELIKEIEYSKCKLGDFVDVWRGMSAYGSANPDRPYNSLEKLTEQHRPMLNGGDVGRYSIKWKNEYIKYGEWLHRPRPSFIYDEAHILVQRIRNPKLKQRIVATIDLDKFISSDGLSNLVLKENHQDLNTLNSLLAIINSKLINYWFSYYFFDVNIKPEQLREIPIPESFNNGQLINLVEQILSIKQADAAADTSGLEAEIDVLVYRLYNLTYDEVLLVDPAFALSEAAYSQPEVSYN